MPTQLSRRIQKKLNQLLDNTGDMALKRRAKNIIEGLNPQSGEKILDVGCGDGYYLFLLSNLGLEINLTGVDFDKRALASARQNLGGRKIRLVYGDLTRKLPFVSGTFDKVVMSEVVEHLPNDVEGLREVYRILKPGGVLCLTVPNANYPFFWDPVNWLLEHLFGTHIKAGFWAGFWNQHDKLYDSSQIKRAIKSVGLKIEVVRFLTWWCLPFNHNFLYFGAKRLHDGRFSPKIAISVNKFRRTNQKVAFINLIFKFINLFDRMNDIFQANKTGVSIFITATK